MSGGCTMDPFRLAAYTGVWPHVDGDHHTLVCREAMKHFASTFRSELTGAIRVAPRESIFNSEYLEGVAAFWRGRQLGATIFLFE